MSPTSNLCINPIMKEFEIAFLDQIEAVDREDAKAKLLQLIHEWAKDDDCSLWLISESD